MEFGTNKWITVMPDKLKYTEKLAKEPHPVFTILYYIPEGGDRAFKEWLYGYDIFLKVQEALPDLNYEIVSGDSCMRYVYPHVDFYLRPNRHDGHPRIVDECEIQDIPYYWTKKNPSAEGAIAEINKCYDAEITS